MFWDERLLKHSSLILSSLNSINRQRFCPVILERELKSKSKEEKSKLIFVETSFLQKRIGLNSERKNAFLIKRFLIVLKDRFFPLSFLQIRKRSPYHSQILLSQKAQVMKSMKSCPQNLLFIIFDLQNPYLKIYLLSPFLQDHNKIHFNLWSWFLQKRCMQFLRC